MKIFRIAVRSGTHPPAPASGRGSGVRPIQERLTHRRCCSASFEAKGLAELSRGWSESASDTLGRRDVHSRVCWSTHPDGVREAMIAR